MKDDDDRPRMVKCTPEDARLIWEALERRGIVPTDRKVLDEITNSGRFLPIDRTTILRWRKAGWKPVRHIRYKADPKKVMSAIREADPEQYAALMQAFNISVAEMVQQYTDLGDMNMMRGAARHCYANAMVLSNLLQSRKNDPELNIAEAGKMAKAIADSVKSANQAMAILVNMGDELVRTVRMIEGKVVDNSGEQVPDGHVKDHYGDIFEHFKQPALAGPGDDGED